MSPFERWFKFWEWHGLDNDDRILLCPGARATSALNDPMQIVPLRFRNLDIAGNSSSVWLVVDDVDSSSDVTEAVSESEIPESTEHEPRRLKTGRPPTKQRGDAARCLGEEVESLFLDITSEGGDDPMSITSPTIASRQAASPASNKRIVWVKRNQNKKKRTVFSLHQYTFDRYLLVS